MKNSNFEDIFRESGDYDRGFDFNKSSWDDLEKRLDQPKKGRRFFWIWFLVPIFLGTGLFANMLFDSNTELATTSIIPEKAENQPIKKTQNHSSITREVSNQAPKTIDLPVEKNNKQNVINTQISKENILRKVPLNTKITTNTNSDNNTISKVQKSSSDIFTSVEENILQPKNTKQHQQSLLSKNESILSTKGEAALPTQELKDKRKVQKSNILLNSKVPANSLEGSGMVNLVNIADNEITPRKRTWEIGLSVGFSFPETFSSIAVLTTDSTLATSSIPYFPDNTPTTLYVEGFESTNLKKRFSPLFRLSVGKEIKNSWFLRGGIILLRDSPPKNRTIDLLNNTPHEYAANFESFSNYWVLDIGIYLQPNRKKWRPFFGVAPLFTFLHQQENNLNIYSSGNEIVESTTLFSDNIGGFDFTGLNIEAGMKYRISPKFEVGLQMYTIGFPFLNSEGSFGNGNFSKPQFATSISYKL